VCGCVYHTTCIERWMRTKSIQERSKACVISSHNRLVTAASAAPAGGQEVQFPPAVPPSGAIVIAEESEPAREGEPQGPDAVDGVRSGQDAGPRVDAVGEDRLAVQASIVAASSAAAGIESDGTALQGPGAAEAGRSEHNTDSSGPVAAAALVEAESDDNQ
jgi:hypothetical protein